MTNKQAKAIIENNKDNTAWYNGFTNIMGEKEYCSYNDMYDFFRGRCGMGKAETLCILSALKISGAKFTGERTLDY